MASKKPRSLSLVSDVPCFARRETLQLAMGAVAASVVRPAAAAEAPFPNLGDHLVRVTDEGTYTPLRVSDIEKSAKPVIAYPYDAATNTVHSESRLNKVLLVYFDPAQMDAETQKRAAGGVLAFSAICTHQGCEVSEWAPAPDSRDLLCFCHFSKYAPLKAARVISGPAPRSLPTLPLALKEDELVVAGHFSASPGAARA
ncbi:ubiquinol-cytochrome c reductase iron-sulfur subunit [Methyloferula stellata]|uniref:QcrA and Rieske domain-containing protein n=1 Tax=Methyloferula stellata TaxID=876270 RepID=UPI0003676BAC|nr:ubiquinol-cytochrome c reductase iron-sulfur subunit [Methyloferula stellata]